MCDFPSNLRTFFFIVSLPTFSAVINATKLYNMVANNLSSSSSKRFFSAGPSELYLNAQEKNIAVSMLMPLKLREMPSRLRETWNAKRELQEWPLDQDFPFHTCQSFQLVPDSSRLLPFQWPLRLEKCFPRNPCCPTKMTSLPAIPQKDIVDQYSFVRPHLLWERCPHYSNGNLETRKTTSRMK